MWSYYEHNIRQNVKLQILASHLWVIVYAISVLLINEFVFLNWKLLRLQIQQWFLDFLVLNSSLIDLPKEGRVLRVTAPHVCTESLEYNARYVLKLLHLVVLSSPNVSLLGIGQRKTVKKEWSFLEIVVVVLATLIVVTKKGVVKLLSFPSKAIYTFSDKLD